MPGSTVTVTTETVNARTPVSLGRPSEVSPPSSCNTRARRLSAPSLESDQRTSSPKNRMPPLKSLTVAMAFILLVVINMTIMLPTAPNYAEELGGDLIFAGVMTGLGPVICLIAAYPLQLILDCVSLKSVFFVMGAGNVAGNVIYACAGLTHSKWTLFVSKVVCGTFSSNSPLLLYIARTVGMNHRSKVMMVMSATLGAGYAIGPLLAFFIGVFCKELHIDNLVLDQNSLPGWLMAGFFFVYILAQHFLFEDPRLLFVEGEGAASEEVLPKAGSPKEEKINLPAMTFLLFLQVISALMLGLFEVFTSIHCSRTWGWTEEFTGLYIAAVMGGNLIVSVLASLKVSGHFSDRSIIFYASGLGIAGAALSFDFASGRPATVALFTLGSFVHLSSLSVLRASANALCSKIVPNRLQNTMATAVMVTLTLGRALGPVLAAVVNVTGYASIVMSLMAASLGGTTMTYAHLKAHETAV